MIHHHKIKLDMKKSRKTAIKKKKEKNKERLAWGSWEVSLLLYGGRIAPINSAMDENIWN